MSAKDILVNVLTETEADYANVQGASLAEPRSPEVALALQCMNLAGRDLVRRAEWSKLILDHTLPPTNERFSPIAPDFHRFTSKGGVRVRYNEQDNHTIARMVVSPEMWVVLPETGNQYTYYRLLGNRIYWKRAGLVQSLHASYEYVSNAWVGNTADNQNITGDTDVVLIPERLIEKGALWRWYRLRGLPYQDRMAEFEADLESELLAERGEE